jgi:hypothetical protein
MTLCSKCELYQAAKRDAEEAEAYAAELEKERDEWKSLAEAAIRDDASKNIHYAELQAKLQAALNIMVEVDNWVESLGIYTFDHEEPVTVFKNLHNFLSDVDKEDNMQRFDEYGAYGENNPPVGQTEPKPYAPPATETDDSGGFNITFITEEHLPDGNVKLTFDVGDKAMHYACEAGLKLFLYTGALDITLGQAFEAIWETYKGKLDYGNDD